MAMCPENCTSCTDHPGAWPSRTDLYGKAFCTECNDGYFSTTEFFQCQNVCPVGCATCSAETGCTSCADGYYLPTRPGACQQCPEGCTDCTGDDQCIRCKSGYFLAPLSLSYGLCPPCPPGCISCRSLEYCDSCKSGLYGKMCTLPCLTGCKNNHCLQTDGSCECKDGFAGTRCDMCQVGKYGPECQYNCFDTCDNSECSKESGECIECKENMIGIYCQDCVSFKFGWHCNLTCPDNCLNAYCERYSGFCLKCTTNFQGTKCQDCAAGIYGGNCTLDCPRNCLNHSCDRNSGNCFQCSHSSLGSKCEICVEGYSGDMCCLNYTFCDKCLSNETCSECVLGKYGKRCEDDCLEECDDQTCDRDKGICVKEAWDGKLVATGVAIAVMIIVIAAILTIGVIKKRSLQQKQPVIPVDRESVSYVNVSTIKEIQSQLSPTYEYLKQNEADIGLYNKLN